MLYWNHKGTKYHHQKDLWCKWCGDWVFSIMNTKIKNKVQYGRGLRSDHCFCETNSIWWNLILSNLEYKYDLLKRQKDI